MKEKQLNYELLEKIRQIKAEHPFWGYRRVWAYIRYYMYTMVNSKRIYRLMKENGLLVSKDQKHRAIRTPQKSKPRAEKMNQYWGIDMTKILTYSGWIYLVLVLDWYSKKIIGSCVTQRCTAEEWLSALDMAINNQYPNGILEAEEKPQLISDNGSQPTSEKFMRQCSFYGIKQIFTSYNNPKGNAETERVMRTIKEDLVWTNEFSSYYEFMDAWHSWVYKYNNVFPRQVLNYKTPAQFEQLCNAQKYSPIRSLING